ncbi:MAG: GNAT family N-acetyltransferase [Saccharofermentanales bacterium]|jgi:ribosomal-protein-alanine N-acetyltransferase
MNLLMIRPKTTRTPPMTDSFVLNTPRLQLRILDSSAASAVLDYYVRNRSFHQPWFAARSNRVFRLEEQRAGLADEHSDFLAGRALPFWLFRRNEPERIIGRFAFTDIIYGCLRSCYTAYHLDQAVQGKGLALEAGQAAIRVLLEDFRLHRIQASIMPTNSRSIALAERLGFRCEGLSPRYLKINNRWQDHLHYVRLADDRPPASPAPLTKSGRLNICVLQPMHISLLNDYYQRNKDHIERWNILTSVDSNGSSSWHRYVFDALAAQARGRQHDFLLFWPERPDWLAGHISCQEIKPLPYSSCEIGFSIDRLLSGRGLMPEVLSNVIAWLFAGYRLNRITARCVQGNQQSLRLLKLLGFREEGIDRQGLYHGQSWKDVIRLALLKSDFHYFE